MERVARQRLHEQMERLADGDRTAFPAEAADVAQQTLLDVFSNAGRFDPSRDALSWVLGIAAYNCKSARKRRARRREAEEVDITSTDATPEERLVEADLRRAFEEILGTLKPIDVEAIEAILERRPAPRDRSGRLPQETSTRPGTAAARVGSETWHGVTTC